MCLNVQRNSRPCSRSSKRAERPLSLAPLTRCLLTSSSPLSTKTTGLDRFPPLLSALTHATCVQPLHLAQWRPQSGGDPRRLSHPVRRRTNGARPLVEPVVPLYGALGAIPYHAASLFSCADLSLSRPQPSARSRSLISSGFSSASMTTETASSTNVPQPTRACALRAQ